jgi:hypothetical protein
VVVVASDIQAGSSSGDRLRLVTSNLAQREGAIATLLPGDVAARGLASEYAGSFARTWGRLPGVLAAPGNHDYLVPGAAPFMAYFAVNRTYRSRNLGRWHLVVLDSETATGVGSAQYAWLKADLAASANRPILAVIHRPRYASFYGDDVAEQPLVDLLVAAQADVLVAGHEHAYQRLGRVGGVLMVTDTTAGLTPRTLSTLDPHVVKAVSATGYLRISLTDTGYTLQLKDTAGVVRDSVSAPVHHQP